MKTKFSSFAKLFLAGICFVAVGCTDYGQDIQNLNDRIDALETDQIDPLKAELGKAQEALKAAQDAIDKHQKQHEDDIAELKQADKDLQAAIDAAAKKAAEDLAALATELKKADVDLSNKIDAEAKKLQDNIDAVGQKAEDNKKAIEAAAKKAADDLKALADELKAKDVALGQQIENVAKAFGEALEDEVEALEALIATTQGLLEKAIADAKAELEAADAAQKAELEGKITALETALNKTIKNLEDKLQAEIDRLDVAVQGNASAITALQNALKETDDRLQKAIKDGDEALAAALQETEGKLTKMIQDYITEVNGKITEINKTIGELKSVDENLQKQITDLAGELFTTNEKVAANAKAIEGLVNALDAHKAEFLAFKATTEGAIADLYTKIGQLEAKDTEILGLIDKLDERLKANEALAQNNAEEIKKNKELFDEFVKATNETLDLLKKADATLQSNIDALDAQLQAYKKEVEAEIQKVYGAILESQAKLEADMAKLDAKILANTQAIEANAGLIADNLKLIQANALAIEGLTTRLNDLQNAHNELKASHDKLLADFTAYQTEINNTIKGIKEEQVNQNKTINLHTEQISALQESLSKLQQTVTENYTKLDAKIDELKKSLETMINNVAKDVELLKGRIQSLVFVPQHKDGKATIEYAKFGSNIVEGQSTLLYQVHPAACAPAVKKEDLSFMFSEELASTRSNEQLEVVDVLKHDINKGIIAVVVKAHNLHNVYAGKDYAVSLVFTHNDVETGVNNNIASSYTVLAAESESNASVITWGLNSGYKTAAELEYIATGSVNVLGGIDYIFYEDGVEQSHDYITNKYGLLVKPLEVAPTYNNDTYVSALDGATKNSVDVFNNVVRADNGYDVNIAIAADKATVGLVQTIGYGFTLHTVNNSTINAPIATIQDAATVTITKIKGKMTLDPQTITWTRTEDNEADGITPKSPTSRTVTTVAGKLLDINDQELTTAGTTYEEIIAGLATITVNGAPLAAPYNVVLGGTNAAPTVSFEGFEWNKDYSIVASYEIDNIVAELSIDIKTVQNSSVVTLDPVTITWNYNEDRHSETNYAGPKALSTFRNAETKADDAKLYADVIATGKLVSITPAPSPFSPFGFKFKATGVEASGFAWNKDYAVEALYAIEDQLVTVKVLVHTEKAPFKGYKLELPAEQWKLTSAFVDQSETVAEVLDAIHANLTNLGDITAADYLKDVFVTNPVTVVATINNGGTPANTKLEIAADGQTVKSIYNINDFTTIPEKVDYVLDITTWYGEKIQITKTLNIGLQPVEVKLAEETWALPVGFVNQSETAAEALDAIHAQVVAHSTVDDKFAVADYLKAIFVDHAAVAETKANGVAHANTALVVEPATGATIKSTYDMTEIPTSVDKVDYTYNYTTWYGQTIAITKTVNFGLQPVEITLPKSEVKLSKDLVATFGPDALAEIFEKVANVDKTAYTADAYLKTIFVDNAYASVDNANGAALANTKLVVDPATGATAVAEYNYADFTTANPTEVEYKSTYTTWYGQEIVVNKLLTIELPKYNYKHVDLWVSVNGAESYSTVVPTYYPELPTNALKSYSVNNVKMNDAFAVVDEAGNVVTDLASLGLVSTFAFRTVPQSAGITLIDNEIQYNGADDFVEVKGSLKLVNSNGVETVLPTKFDAGETYANYVVNKYDPIGDFTATTYSAEILGGSQVFTCNSMKQLSLKDYRGQTYSSFDLLKDGAWVTGDDNNGFATGYTANGIYGLSDIEFECTPIPAEYASYLKFNKTSGVVTFNYTSEMQMVNDIKLTITAKVKYIWGERVTSFDCHFIRKK